MKPHSKIQRKEFRVKFSGDQIRQKTIIQPREIIIESRPRVIKNRISIKDTLTGIQKNEETNQNDASNRQLKIESFSRNLQYTNVTNSNIVTDLKDLNFLFENQCVNFRLLFRASNHKFSVKAFHELCDDYEETLVLCLTEDNKIIGGYTPLTWQDHFHRNSTHFKTDFAKKTFLFSVSNKAKYPLVKSLKNKAICCFKAYGPTFGGGYDLLIGDKANQGPFTTSYFPRNFEHPTGQGNNVKRQFAGTSRKNFKLLEWQVFHVMKSHSLQTIENNILELEQPPKLPKRAKSIFQQVKIAIKKFCENFFE